MKRIVPLAAFVLMLTACTTPPINSGAETSSYSSVASSSASSSISNPLINVFSPLPNAVVTSPLMVTGEARGNWYFEASFPVRLYDGVGNQIALGIAQAQSDWMTTNFVPFVATLTFSPPTTATGTLVLEKDNPSGLPENDDSVSIPVIF